MVDYKLVDIGTLYIVATPIGNLEDVSQRAIRVLKDVDLIAAEDTRHSRKLLEHFAIQTSLTSYHEHNDEARADELLQRLRAGDSIALISDAGTPLISDPGYPLVQAAHEAGVNVVPIPGASALIAALSVSGIPCDHFSFEGFLPAKPSARLARLQPLAQEQRTLIFYESSHRIQACLEDLCRVFGEARQACLARELTKKFETIRNDTLCELRRWLETDPNQSRGEFVLIIAPGEKIVTDEAVIQIDLLLTTLLQHWPLKKAVAIAVDLSGRKKNQLYERALQLQALDQ